MSKTLLTAAALAVLLVSVPARAGDQDHIGQIVCGAWNFAPRGTMLAAGQLLPISQNTALFSLLGTTYGGDGRTTFALPDLRGRVIVGDGQGPGLANYDLGGAAGVEAQSLQPAQLPAHTHLIAARASSADATLVSPAGNVQASKQRSLFFAAPTAGANLAAGQTDSAGQGQPVGNMQPFLTINCVIAVQGIFPARN